MYRMIALADIISRHEAACLQQYRHTLLPSHRQALAAMKSCRTSLAPRLLAQCSACDERRLVPHSCGHRNCPHCQHHESQQWLERQLKRQVPADYFLVTFTVPAEFRALAWRHQRLFYALLFECAWATVSTFSQNDKHLHGHPGAVSVLHTHSRRLDYHPHLHLAMPAAALDAKSRRWRTKPRGKGTGYLFNHRALAKVFRAKLLAALTREGLQLPACHPEKWVVDCKGVGNGEKAPGLSRPLPLSGRRSGEGHPVLRRWARQLSLPRQPYRKACGAHGERRRLPVADPAARVAQGLPSRPQLRLPAPQQQGLDRAVAGRAQGHAPRRPGLDETATAVPVQLLRGADAGGEQTHSIGVRPMAQIKFGRGRKRVSPLRLLC